MSDENEYLGFLLVRAYRSDKKRIVKIVQKIKLTPTQWMVLHRLDQEDGMPAHKIVERLYSDSSTIMSIIDRLEKKGLVRREGDSKDRRVNHVFLTQKAGHNTYIRCKAFSTHRWCY